MSLGDDFHKYEVVNNASIILRFWDDIIYEHSMVKLDPELVEAADKVAGAMGDFYQLAGGKFL